MSKRTVNQIKESHYVVEVEVDRDVWKKAQEKALEKLAKNVSVKGFRKGKVPAEVAKKHIDQGQLFNEAINDLLPATFKEVLDEEKLRPFARPSVDVTKLSDEDLTLSFKILTAPKVNIGKYKEHHLGKEEVKVTPEEVEHAMKARMEQNAELVLKEGAAELGDTVVIDFEGFIDGKPFEGGKAENYSLELGSHSFIPGFEEQLIGVKKDDEKDIQVTFPEQYVESLKGKDATFKIKVHEVRAKKVPELNDEAVKELDIKGVETVEALKGYEETHLKSHKEQDARRAYWEKLIDAIIKDSQMTIDDEIIEEEVHAMKDNVARQAAQAGMNLEQYLSITGQSEEQLNETLKKEADKNIRTVLIMEKVAELEELNVTPEEIDFEIAKIADAYKMEFDKVKEMIAKDMDRFTSSVRTKRIEDFLINHND